MDDKSINSRDVMIADAIHHLANEIRILSFGKGTSITENSRGAVEDLSFSVSDSGKEISASIRDVAQSISEVADSIKALAEAIDQPRNP